jgi:hypothetical protein
MGIAFAPPILRADRQPLAVNRPLGDYDAEAIRPGTTWPS